MHYFEEEAFLHYTLFNFKELREQYGDRIFELLEKYDPETYEAFCAYKANQEIYEFVSTRKRDEDYYND